MKTLHIDSENERRDIALVVDLDGTVIKTDLLHESAVSLFRTSWTEIFRIPFWLIGGKARLKHEIAVRCDVETAILPYNTRVVEFVEAQRACGRKILLASASNEKFVKSVSEHLPVFDHWIASSTTVNKSGRRKLDAIESYLGGEKFDYMGNGSVDLPIWEKSERAIVVNAPDRVVQGARRVCNAVTEIRTNNRTRYPFLTAIRPQQWLKNLLLFLPLLASHRVMELSLVSASIAAFGAFCMTASATYLINDLMDLESDRVHRSKRNRPLANGDLPLLYGAFGAAVLLLSAIGLSMFLPLEFRALLLTYIVVSSLYTVRLKRVIILDVLTLASLYTLRIIAGSAAVSVPLSFWLLAFSMFMFLNLALIKRYSELQSLSSEGGKIAKGRGYRTDDIIILGQMGISSGLIAVLVLALYINSEMVVNLYSRPWAIWFLCPLVLYWVCRIWLLAARGAVDEDPLVFAAQDRKTRILAVVTAVVLLVAI